MKNKDINHDNQLEYLEEKFKDYSIKNMGIIKYFLYNLLFFISKPFLINDYYLRKLKLNFKKDKNIIEKIMNNQYISKIYEINTSPLTIEFGYGFLDLFKTIENIELFCNIIRKNTNVKCKIRIMDSVFIGNFEYCIVIDNNLRYFGEYNYLEYNNYIKNNQFNLFKFGEKISIHLNNLNITYKINKNDNI